MIKNHWYAVEFGHVVGSSPVHAEIMGQQLVLWRDRSGAVIAQSDVCIHRGGSLAGGQVINNCVRCPYHGWTFDSDGVCTDIPANKPGLPIPKKARVDTYPCVERYGYVFVFLGDLPEDERPPLPYLDVLDQVPEARAEGFRAITGEFEWAANFERVLENGVDIAHAPFVHAGSFGNPDSPVVEDYEVVEILHEGWNIGNLSTVHLDPPEPSGVWKLISKKSKERPPIMTRTGIFFPNMTMLEVNLPLGTMRIFTAVVPVNANKSISKWTMMRSFFTGSWADKDSRRRTDKIFLEDQATVEAQRPELVPVDLSAELHVKSDANQIAYRRWRQGALDKGWGIDQHVVGRDGDYHEVRVIPSPSRRNNPELANAWVLKELDAKMKHETKPALATETTTESVDRA
ncbi:MAG TPA: aromatic ring-hydroxylating dioxygenase subunit alpha [Acidimicrobiaceae bacterium]|jgi:phenylpropionate dioxygenase-like ring-hydroxylating dioxygenase large terminal subunit|nr:aromatic ring-hydroxylating dioxygenase subunit alpha [Acidimicrobiaceae bacterium]